MTRPLRVLLLEDNDADCGLILHELRRSGYDVTLRRAAGRDDFLRLLGQGFDVVLADYRLPDFTAIDAHLLLRANNIDTPLIVVTATLGDEEAAHCIRMGATDYLLKDRLHRLGPAIQRALDERRQRLERDAAVLHSEQRFRDVAELAGDVIWETDRDHRYTFIEGGGGEIAGISVASMIGMVRWVTAGGDVVRDEDWRHHKAVLDAHQPFRQFRHTFRGGLGQCHHLSVSGKPFFRPGRTVCRLSRRDNQRERDGGGP